MSESYDLALKAALGRLKTRERFVAELQDWLLTKGYEEGVVGEVLAHLARRNVLNDDRAAEVFVRRNSGKRAVGAARLRSQLARHGVTLECELNESERAQQALAGHRSVRTVAQAARFLASRGFDEDATRIAIEERFGPSE